MSTRYEWISTDYARLEYVPPHHNVYTGELSDEDTGDEYDTGEFGALLIAGDEVTVLHGSPASLRELLARAFEAIPEDE